MAVAGIVAALSVLPGIIASFKTLRAGWQIGRSAVNFVRGRGGPRTGPELDIRPAPTGGAGGAANAAEQGLANATRSATQAAETTAAETARAAEGAANAANAAEQAAANAARGTQA